MHDVDAASIVARFLSGGCSYIGPMPPKGRSSIGALSRSLAFHWRSNVHRKRFVLPCNEAKPIGPAQICPYTHPQPSPFAFAYRALYLMLQSRSQNSTRFWLWRDTPWLQPAFFGAKFTILAFGYRERLLKSAVPLDGAWPRLAIIRSQTLLGWAQDFSGMLSTIVFGI